VLPIEQACYWLARLPRREVTPLQGAAEADVAIVGAGLTGLWTALFLKQLEPGVDVAVVEQGIAAFGGSGRNAGMLSETVDHSHSLAVQHFGMAEAARLARLGETNVAELTAFLADRRIDCDYEATGRLMVALTPAQVEEGRRNVELSRSLGIDSFRQLSAEEVRAEVHSPLYQGGVAVSGGGILDPARMTDGLRREAVRLGVRVFERSPVLAVERDGAGLALRTETGRLRARRGVLATSAYTHHLLPRVTRRFIPLYDYIMVSDPLTPAQWETIGWRGRQGITDGRSFFNYYRPTPDGRILWGTSEAAYYPGNQVDPSRDHSPRHYHSLRESWQRHFPALAELEFPYAWGGAICSTTRLTPYFGRALGGRLTYGLGFTGHGLGTTRIAGRILAHLALDRGTDLLDLSLVRKPPFPYPPEPLRRLAVGAVTRALRRVDDGGTPSLLLRLLDRMGLGFSS
jgi:glycine/D-amino acid oxidase-like deaminating enzyme